MNTNMNRNRNMELLEAIHTVRPLKGQVIPIKTVQETQSKEEFGDALVAEVSMKSASKVIKALDSAFPRDPTFSLQHLRRFAKWDQLPERVRAQIRGERMEEAVPLSFTTSSSPSSASSQTIFVLISPPLPERQMLESVLVPFAPSAASSSHRAEGAANEEQEGTASPTTQATAAAANPPEIRLYTTQVPLQPPLNPLQAEQWSKTLWPVTFNPAAPRAVIAPPPQILNRARESIQPWAGHYLALARILANEAVQSGRGRGVGAVIVDPSIEVETSQSAEKARTDESMVEWMWMHPVVAVAGDARYSRREGGGGQPSARATLQASHGGDRPGAHPASFTYDPDLEGGPELHALMRAVDMVARRRREEDGERDELQGSTTSDTRARVVSGEKDEDEVPLTPLESYFLYRGDDGNEFEPEQNAVSEAEADTLLDLRRPATKRQKIHPTVSLTGPGKGKEEEEATGGSSSSPPSATSPDSNSTAPIDRPTSNPRTRILPRSQGGYLCTDLDIYLSHEPCLCCCMGLLLSRFRAVVFPRRGRMSGTGGLASEKVLERNSESSHAKGDVEGGSERMYYGLHWRKELNWRALGFEFVEDEEEDLDDDEEARQGLYHSLKSVPFHA